MIRIQLQLGIIFLKKVKSKSLGKKETEEFHTSVARGMFVAKRLRPDIHQSVVVLSMNIKEPNKTG